MKNFVDMQIALREANGESVGLLQSRNPPSGEPIFLKIHVREHR
jgi:hypothetical protein